jgi:hypothetical protein
MRTTNTEWSALRADGLPLQLGVRFRLLDGECWQEGRLENLTAEGITFLTDLPLEVGAYLELVLPVGALTAQGRQLPSLCARVVRRVLNRWPDDVHTAVAAIFVTHPGERLPGTA